MSQWREGRIARKTAWNDTHISLVIDIEGPAFEAGQFVRVGVDIDEERISRPYSLVNPPWQPRLEIFFNIVPEGPLSAKLASLERGDAIWLSEKASGLLTLTEVPQSARHLWLLATGTGVGPFLSILQTEDPWQRFDTVILGYGVRYLRDQAYGELIRQLQETHGDRFRFVPFVTGEPTTHAINTRIPAAIADGSLERQAGLALEPDASHVMLCGHSGMIADTCEILEQRGMRRHRRREPGHISTEKYH
jgi:ferredoxin--NADP+ reductase